MGKKRRKNKNKQLSRLKKESETRVLSESRSVSASFSGPLPPPNILQGYEAILSGAADRIIKMAEKQSDHRQELEKKVITSNVINEKIGMWMAFILTIVLMGFGFYLVFSDKDGIGFLAIFGPVIFHAGNYIYQKKQESSRLHNKES